MRIDEISVAARKTVKKMNSLYITYSVHGTLESYDKLKEILEIYSDSLDIDIKIK